VNFSEVSTCRIWLHSRLTERVSLVEGEAEGATTGDSDGSRVGVLDGSAVLGGKDGAAEVVGNVDG